MWSGTVNGKDVERALGGGEGGGGIAGTTTQPSCNSCIGFARECLLSTPKTPYKTFVSAEMSQGTRGANSSPISWCPGFINISPNSEISHLISSLLQVNKTENRIMLSHVRVNSLWHSYFAACWSFPGGNWKIGSMNVNISPARSIANDEGISLLEYMLETKRAV
jgi:hypothetical protein